jgi:hypothetical protein
MSPAARLDALAERGVMIYRGSRGELRARCEPCFSHILESARPMLAQRRAELLAFLQSAQDAMDRESSAGPQPTALPSVSDGVCPECALP